MALDVTLASLHHLLAFALVGVLIAEWALLKGVVAIDIIGRLPRLDLLYGILAASLLVVGGLRVSFGIKGAAFYAHNPFFWLKLALYIATALLSIVPTLRFVRWRKALRATGALPSEAEWASTRKLAVLQAHLLAGVMICAALMARGIGS